MRHNLNRPLRTLSWSLPHAQPFRSIPQGQ